MKFGAVLTSSAVAMKEIILFQCRKIGMFWLNLIGSVLRVSIVIIHSITNTVYFDAIK
jgi:hypothetical protein